MDTTQTISQEKVQRASYGAMALFIAGVIHFGLATPFITALFGYLIARQLGTVLPRKWAAFSFIVLSILLFYVFIHFLGQAINALPNIANRAIPKFNDFANKMGFEIPFNDPGTLKSFIVEEVPSQLHNLAKFAQVFTKEFVYVIIGLVVTCGIFLRGEIDLEKGTHAVPNNVYSVFTNALSERFQKFFRSFHTVMGAQVIISAINTFFTGLFLGALILAGAPLPYSFVIVVVTFLCGLLPIIGNLISNTVIFFIGLSQSVQLGVIALAYLIILHKFEYFLNSKIIGGKIKNPMWLTLLGLLVGERLGGVPGMILAPVILHYIKMEGAGLATAPQSRKL